MIVGSCAAFATAGVQLSALGLVADGAVMPYCAEAYARFQDGLGFVIAVNPVLAAAVGYVISSVALGLSRKVPLWAPFALVGGLVLGSNEFGWLVTVVGTMIQATRLGSTGRGHPVRTVRPNPLSAETIGAW